MARMPGALWIGPTPNMHPGGMIDHHGLVLHIQQGTEQGSEAWFKNPTSQASSHFLNPKAGGLRQLVDTTDRAWAEMAGNYHWVSVENEGLSGQSLTASQVENLAHLVVWLHQVHGMPLQSTDDPNGSGLGWHGMGGAAWGGHYDCPGGPIKAQRAAILARANELLNPSPPEPDMPLSEADINAVASATTSRILGTAVPVVPDENAVRSVSAVLGRSENMLHELRAQVTGLTAALTAVAGQLGKDVDTAAVIAAVQAAIKDAVIHVEVGSVPPAAG